MHSRGDPRFDPYNQHLDYFRTVKPVVALSIADIESRISNDRTWSATVLMEIKSETLLSSILPLPRILESPVTPLGLEAKFWLQRRRSNNSLYFSA
jgi:hypothetical protein